MEAKFEKFEMQEQANKRWNFNPNYKFLANQYNLQVNEGLIDKGIFNFSNIIINSEEEIREISASISHRKALCAEFNQDPDQIYMASRPKQQFNRVL